MPQIKEYRQQVETPGPINQRRYDDMGYEGRGLQELGGAISNFGEIVYKRAQADEVSDLNAKFAEKQAKFTQRLNDELQKGSLNVEKFMEEYDNDVQPLQDNLSTRGGRDYYRESSSSLRNNFLKSSLAGQSELAGLKAKDDFVSGLNNRATALLADPTGYQTAVEQNDLALDLAVQGGTLPYAAAVELKTKGRAELAKAAIRGRVDSDPEGALSELESKVWDTEITGEMKHDMQAYAKTAIRAREQDEAKRERDEKKAQEAGYDKIRNDFLVAIEEGKLTSKMVLKSGLPPTGPGGKEHWLNVLKGDNEGGIKQDKGKVVALYHRIHADDADPSRIKDINTIRKEFGNGLDPNALRFLESEFLGKRSPEGQYEAQLKKVVEDAAYDGLAKPGPTGLRSVKGRHDYATWLMEFNKKFNAGKEAGKSVESLLNPESPDFVGKFQRKSRKEIFKDNREAMRPQPKSPEEVKGEDESPDAYLERMKRLRAQKPKYGSKDADDFLQSLENLKNE